MARKTKADIAKAKQAKQKKLAIGGGILLVALLAFQAPKMLKMMNQKAKPPIVLGSTGATTPGSTPTVPTDPNSLAAPTLAGTPTAAAPTTDATSAALVSAVPVTPDPGQLEAFNKLATKDPFAVQVSASGAGASSGSGSGSGSSSSKGSGSSTQTPPVSKPPPTQTAPAPSAPAPSSATISLNGEQLTVSVGSDFPQSGATFDRVGAIFHLVSLSAKTAKIAIVGGSYANGANTITLTMGKPVTLQNTADGTRYVLVLQPTPAQAGGSGGTSTTPTTTTPSDGGSTMSAIVPHTGTH
jgi:hypothetical protein